MNHMQVTYRLDTSARPPSVAPTLDPAQRQVVDHPGGPLLVLAGPGTGKTTTLVEAVVDRVDHRGLSPDQLLVLTFGRRAAEELRDRITGRLGRTCASPMSSTFHSFCYALVRRYQPTELYADPLRLLSAPEQDVMLRELLRHSAESGRASWPASLHPALGTRGFAREVHAVLSKAREVGLDPDELTRAGAESGRPAWAAAGAFMREYLQVLDFESSLDYSELVHRAVLLAESADVQREVRGQFRSVFVDEYQDTDPNQVRLLKAIAGDGRDLVVVGDPDQSIYGFRGADVRGILDFPAEFRRADGRPGDVVALGTTRRSGTRLLTASRRVAAGIAVRGSIDAATFQRFRNPVVAAGDGAAQKDGAAEDTAGRLDVLTFGSSGAEADNIADIVRRAHLEDGVPWSQIAVLVRSGVAAIPRLRRVLVAGRIPVEVAGDEVPLRSEPAVAPLLLAMRCVADPEALTAETARALLLSPLGGLDAPQLRRLGRLLRRRDRESAAGDRLPLPSGELLRQALAEPALLIDLRGTEAARALRLSELLAAARASVAEAAAEEALWTLWAGTSWPQRLRAAAEQGGPAARAAHRDLDAVCALFEVAARTEEKQPRTGVVVFLEQVDAQQIPGDTLADRGVRRDAVRLLTAHRSKGLEWRVVVVAGVQEGSWPDVRRRGSLLQADQLGSQGLVEPLGSAALLAEERRLFYVAVTRARQRLVVTAVASPEPDGDQPSRFLTDLGGTPRHCPGRPTRPLSLPGLVAELRRTAGDPACSDALRAAAAARLARLADRPVTGDPVSVFADPDRWWGLRERTHSEVPLRAEDQAIRLSASALSALNACPVRWFLSREAAGQSARSSAAGFGNLIHVLAQHLGNEETAHAEEMIRHLDSVWDQLQFDSPWIARRERIAAEEAIRRFARWHNSRPHRTPVGSEVEFELETPLDSGERIVVAGKVDRLEIDEHGRVVVVDFKTGKQLPSSKAVATDLQLAVYQLVSDRGGFASRCGGARSGGAELVQLRADDSGLPRVQVQPPPAVDLDGGRPIETDLAQAARLLREETFAATGNAHCNRCEFARQCPARQRSGGVLS